MNVHHNKPFIGELCFDDLYGVDQPRRNAIAARGIVYLTEFAAADGTYGGTILAASMAQAEDIAIARGLGETVIGTLSAEISEAEQRSLADRARHPHLKRSDDIHRKFGF